MLTQTMTIVVDTFVVIETEMRDRKAGLFTCMQDSIMAPASTDTIMVHTFKIRIKVYTWNAGQSNKLKLADTNFHI